MNLFLFVIDGLGMWSEDNISTYQILENHFGIESSVIFPTLTNLGIGVAKEGKGNLLLQKSIGVGSLEGHREMMAHVSESKHTIFTQGVPVEILRDAETGFGFSCIGNTQGRGKQIIPKYWEEHLKRKSPIIYSGFDYTLSIAFKQGLFDVANIRKFAKELMVKLQSNGFSVRKFIVREFDDQTTKISEKELFYPVNFDGTLKNLGFETLVVNKKIQDIFDFKDAIVIDAKFDNDCFNYLSDIHYNADNSFVFFNLGDFDYNAHIGNIDGCLSALKKVDAFLSNFRNGTNDSDYFIITSDHGVKYGNSDLSFSHLKEATLLLVSTGNSVFYHNGIADGHGLILDVMRNICHKNNLSDLGFELVRC